MQHLIYRFDTAGKITGRYCKYTKNQVMAMQRKNNLSADGRFKRVDWQKAIELFYTPSTDDTGGVVTKIVGTPPIPEVPMPHLGNAGS